MRTTPKPVQLTAKLKAMISKREEEEKKREESLKLETKENELRAQQQKEMAELVRSKLHENNFEVWNLSFLFTKLERARDC